MGEWRVASERFPRFKFVLRRRALWRGLAWFGIVWRALARELGLVRVGECERVKMGGILGVKNAWRRFWGILGKWKRRMKGEGPALSPSKG